MMRRLMWTLLAGLSWLGVAQAGTVGTGAEPDGKALYARYCSVCHGKEGHGGVGVPLALPAFLKNASDDYLTKTIHLGRPGRVMPTFSELSEPQVAAIVQTIRSWGSGPGPVYPPTHIAGDVVKGKALFQERCARCHGANGEGGHGTGVTFSRPRDLPIIPPSFNNAGFLSAASDHMIKKTVMEGREGTPMASFLEQGLSEQDIDNVVAFIRSFESEAKTNGHRKLTDEPALMTMESPYDLETTIANVKRSVIGKNYRIIRQQYLENGLVEEGQENKNQVIIYFCNFQTLNDALAIDPRVGLFLPCRVTVTERNGVVTLSSINPKRLSILFNNSELDRACDEMHHIYEEILEESTL